MWWICEEKKFYSNFYGGVLIESTHQKEVSQKPNNAIIKTGLKDEVKWQKVNVFHLETYIELMNIFFELLSKGKYKVRIMFNQNATVATNLQDHH